MPDVIPKFEPGDAPTMTASAAVVGGQIVRVTGARRVAPAGVGHSPFGWALRDALGEAMLAVTRKGIVTCTAAGAVAAGDLLITAANGTVATDNTPALEVFVGQALEAIADGATGLVALRIS